MQGSVSCDGAPPSGPLGHVLVTPKSIHLHSVASFDFGKAEILDSGY